MSSSSFEILTIDLSIHSSNVTQICTLTTNITLYPFFLCHCLLVLNVNIRVVNLEHFDASLILYTALSNLYVALNLVHEMCPRNFPFYP